MWNRIFSLDVIGYMLRVSDEMENEDTIYKFIEHMKENNDYKTVVVMATQWDGYEDVKQANLAINQVGWKHASRFIMLMDCLSKKYKEGKLL